MRVVIGAAALVLVGVFAAGRLDGPAAAPERVVPHDTRTVRVEEHLAALQRIADANGGTRAAGTAGYAASRDYVVRVLEKAGYDPTVQEFRFTTDSGEAVTSWNVLADTTGGDPHHVVVAGAHLDSIPGGPGIDDNGTGSSALLATAQEMATAEPVKKVRFAWWGAEELDLQGSTHYVDDLEAHDPGGLRDIAVYLNFDMIGSSNHVNLVYDGDNSRFPAGGGSLAGPEGSGAVEKVFRDYFASRSLPLAETPLDGRSDYTPFVERGIPVGGLFTGAEQLKTEGEAATFGGEPFAAYEPCYHRSCDVLDQLDMATASEMSRAVSYAVKTLAGLTPRP